MAQDEVAGEVCCYGRPSGTTEHVPLFRAVIGQPVVNNVMQGYNACCFAYGQTGAGKTHTMQGELTSAGNDSSNPEQGLTPRVFQQIFHAIETREGEDQQGALRQYTCKCSFLQIYNEQVSDLLRPGEQPLALRFDAKNGVYVEDLTEHVVVNGKHLTSAHTKNTFSSSPCQATACLALSFPGWEIQVLSAATSCIYDECSELRAVEDAMQLMLQGAANRRVGETNMNRASSRSHSVFTMRVECRSDIENGLTHTQYGTLHMVDLAGSERVKISGANGAALTEASEINLSLTTLGRVISKVRSHECAGSSCARNPGAMLWRVGHQRSLTHHIIPALCSQWL
jgi:kinesin family member 15